VVATIVRVAALLSALSVASAQHGPAYDVLLRRGHVIDPTPVERAVEAGTLAGVPVMVDSVPAIDAGFLPDSISTDPHTGSMNAGMKDMLNVMSKFLAMGLSVNHVISRATWNPAREIRHEELGRLSVGAPADIAVLRSSAVASAFWTCTACD
jgi:Amidohydrolase family